MRKWWYFPIIMPLTKEGHGPASNDEVSEITFEVWDQELTSHASHKYLADAVDDAISRNEARAALQKG